MKEWLWECEPSKKDWQKRLLNPEKEKKHEKETQDYPTLILFGIGWCR